jgi:hypothetical protein
VRYSRVEEMGKNEVRDTLMLGERGNERISFCEKIAWLRPLVLLDAVV